jgi:hypothetical protein
MSRRSPDTYLYVHTALQPRAPSSNKMLAAVKTEAWTRYHQGDCALRRAQFGLFKKKNKQLTVWYRFARHDFLHFTMNSYIICPPRQVLLRLTNQKARHVARTMEMNSHHTWCRLGDLVALCANRRRTSFSFRLSTFTYFTPFSLSLFIYLSTHTPLSTSFFLRFSLSLHDDFCYFPTTIPGLCLKSGHDRFLPYRIQFAIH